METRHHIHEEVFSASPRRMFALLHTPSAVRQWWSAARAIVIAEPGGIWAAAWGDSEDFPDYITLARIAEFEEPRRMVLSDYRYCSNRDSLCVSGFPENRDMAKLELEAARGNVHPGSLVA